MKYIYLGLLAGSLLMPACNNEETSTLYESSSKVNFKVSVCDVKSRTNPIGSTTEDRTSFAENDLIAITNGLEVINYKYAGGGFQGENGKFFTWVVPVKYKAWYPVNENTDYDSFKLVADQTTVQAISTNDYMTAETAEFNTIPEDNSVSLTMQRKMARVKITVSEIAGKYGAEATISSLSVKSQHSAFPVNNEIIAVNPFVDGDGKVNTSYTALVIPGEGKTDANFINVTLQKGETGTETLAVESIPSFESGKSYEYNLSIGKDGEMDVALELVNVKEWTESTISDNASVSNFTPVVPLSEGYTLVWNDEFNSGNDMSKWAYITDIPEGDGQIYIPGQNESVTCTEVVDGRLKIKIQKDGDNVYSSAIRTNDSWTFCYVEARMKLPAGYGTFPAMVMLPAAENAVWPNDGEIDIMEEVGHTPNVVYSTFYSTTSNYNQGNTVIKTKDPVYVNDSQTDFHVYSLMWNDDHIKAYIDGVEHLSFDNDKRNDYSTWPFWKPFYIKLNLAWNKSWANLQPDLLEANPTAFEIDYVRVYQLK